MIRIYNVIFSNRHNYIFGIIFCYAFLGQQLYAQTRAEIESGFLKDLTHINIRVNNQTEKGCDLPDEDIRSLAVNRVVPAGLKVNNDALTDLVLSLLNVSLESGICATSIRIRLRRITRISFPSDEETLWFFTFLERDSIATVGKQKFYRSTLDRLETDIDFVLSRWREVNAGSDFVRQNAPVRGPVQSEPRIVTPSIRVVQQRLQNLGLLAGAIDGVSGPATKQAIQNFQRGQRLPATGDLDLETLRLLFP